MDSLEEIVDDACEQEPVTAPATAPGMSRTDELVLQAFGIRLIEGPGGNRYFVAASGPPSPTPVLASASPRAARPCVAPMGGPRSS